MLETRDAASQLSATTHGLSSLTGLEMAMAENIFKEAITAP